MKEVINKVKMYRKDPCPIDYQELATQAMWYIFLGWSLWLVVGVVDGWLGAFNE
jgi:hypothetical protein|tara:strand:+ start:251 stop:412 length:162 start_codon:yes stop_codon:yes gene_type:complete